MLGHITTFGGNPVSCAAALATLKVLEDEELIGHVEQKGKLFEELLAHHKIKEIRRKGLMFAFEFDTEQEVYQVVKQCMDNGVICFWFLSCPNSFRIAPPLTISTDEIRKACHVILQAINNL